MADDGSEEEDYMSDALLANCADVRPGLYKGKTESHRRLQEQKAEESRKKNFKPAKVMEAEKRDEGLSKSLDSTNKGFALMQKMGYKPGEGIGKSGDGRLEPVGIELKVNRGGLGQEAEKRKRARQLQVFREQQHVKKMKMAQQMQENYREIKINEQKIKRMEKYLRQSRTVCEQLDQAQEITEPLRFYYWPPEMRPAKPEKPATEESEGLSGDETGAGLIEKEEEPVKREAELVGKEGAEPEEEEPEEEEPEVFDQLEELTEYLRTTHLYCIWCGYAFDDTESLSTDCPGNTAECHDDL